MTRSILPSVLTGTRVAIAGWIALAAPESAAVRVTLVLVAAITDGADGYLARRWRVVSPAGATLDLAADGVFFLACALRFWQDDTWPGWLLIAVLSSAVPQAIAQSALFVRTQRTGSPGRWWNKLAGGVAYASAFAGMAGIAPVAWGITQATIAWIAGVMDIAIAARSRPGS